MRILKTVLWSSIGAATLGAAGCDVFVGGRSRHEPTLYVEQQPQYVEAQPQYVVVEQAPPPIIVERRPPPPSQNHIWIDGYWNWDSHQYRWEAGRYAVPPQADVVWIAPSYQRDQHGGRYSPGQWKKQAKGNDHGKDRDHK